MGIIVPKEFYSDGFAYFRGLSSTASAEQHIKAFITGFDRKRLPIFDLFSNRIGLTRSSRIPHSSCEDAIQTPFIALHIEMGLPIIPVSDKSEVHLLACLFYPPGEQSSGTKTRFLCTTGLLSDARWGGEMEIEKRLIEYSKQYADGWKKHNSGRLSCVARLIEGAARHNELTYMRNHRIAEWFNVDKKGILRDGRKSEYDFFHKYDLPIEKLEKQIQLEPGDLLILDNTRVAHGRQGKRKAEELCLLLFGVEDASEQEIKILSKNICRDLKSSHRPSQPSSHSQ